MYNRFGERVREGIGWMGDLNAGNGTPGSRNGPVDDNEDYDYHPGNGRGKAKGWENNSQEAVVHEAEFDDLAFLLLSHDDEEEVEPTADITTDLVKENPFRYAGYYWDRKTQLYYLQARYYEPRDGRFISMDPWRGDITNPLSLNRYVYAYNNPVNYIDPNGHMGFFQTFVLLGGLAAAAVESIIDMLKLPVMIWELGDALISKKITFSELGKAMMQSAAQPIVYVINHFDKVWLDKPKKPSNDEVWTYGKNLGYTIEMVMGAAAALKSLAKIGGKLGKYVEKKAAEIAKKATPPKTNNVPPATPISKAPDPKLNTPDAPKNPHLACNCFTAGTKVITDEGEKPIEEIEVGDKVLAKSDETGEMAYKEVEWLFQRDVEETYNITVGGEVITTTDEHPFWIVGKGWVEAQHLAVGDVLTTSDGKELAIERIEVKQEHATVYNFKVKDFHTYFVSNLGVWTHNKCDIPNTTTKWDIKSNYQSKLTYNFNGKKITAYQDKTGKGYYWAEDVTGHGGSKFKVFEKKGKELHWVADADEYGNFITDKHKSQTGTVIKLN